MEFTSDDRESSVTLVLAEIDDNTRMPGVKLAVTVKDRAFCGTTTTWFEKDNLQQFVSQFDQCAKSGRGSAQLASMGPGEAEIHVTQSDSTGHFMLSHQISVNNYVRAGAVMTTLAGSFDLDSEYLGEYAASLKELATEAGTGQISSGSESRAKMEQPTLQTARLLLRPFVLTDALDVQRLAGAPEVADTTLNLPRPYEMSDAEQWISSQPARFESGSNVAYAITRRTDGVLLGAISLMEISARHRRAEMGYWLGVPFWNQGFMTEAAAALVDYGFLQLRLNKITAVHFVRNPASGRVMQKIGMACEGVQRQHVCKNGIFEDEAVYGLLAEDWNTR